MSAAGHQVRARQRRQVVALVVAPQQAERPQRRQQHLQRPRLQRQAGAQVGEGARPRLGEAAEDVQVGAGGGQQFGGKIATKQVKNGRRVGGRRLQEGG